MPYKLRKAPRKDLYWVVNKEDGRKFSKEPLPKEDAKAQMRALYAREGGYPKRGKGITSSRPARVAPAPAPEHAREEEPEEDEELSRAMTSESIAAPEPEPPVNPQARRIHDLERLARLYRPDREPHEYADHWLRVYGEMAPQAQHMMRWPKTWLERDLSERTMEDVHRAVIEALGMARRVRRGGTRTESSAQSTDESETPASRSANILARRIADAQYEMANLSDALRQHEQNNTMESDEAFNAARRHDILRRSLPALQQELEETQQRAEQQRQEALAHRRMAEALQTRRPRACAHELEFGREGRKFGRGKHSDLAKAVMKKEAAYEHQARLASLLPGKRAALAAMPQHRGAFRNPQRAAAEEDINALNQAIQHLERVSGKEEGKVKRMFHGYGKADLLRQQKELKREIRHAGEELRVLDADIQRLLQHREQVGEAAFDGSEEEEQLLQDQHDYNDLQNALADMKEDMKELKEAIKREPTQHEGGGLSGGMDGDEDEAARMRRLARQHARNQPGAAAPAPPSAEAGLAAAHARQQVVHREPAAIPPAPALPEGKVAAWVPKYRVWISVDEAHFAGLPAHGSGLSGGDLNSVGQTIADVGRNVILPGINEVVPGLGTTLQKTGDFITGLFTPQADIDAYNAQQAADAASRAQIAAENQYWASQANAGNPNAALRLPANAPREQVAQAMMMGLGKPRFGASAYFNA